MLIQSSLFEEAPKPAYFNTTKINGKPLIQAEITAKDQETNILAIFQELSPLSPSDVWRIFERRYGSILLTSVRRSITNLTTQKKLVKTAIQKKGVYKRNEFIWKVS